MRLPNSAVLQAARVTAAGFPARVETVTVPATADYYPSILGYRVRVGRFATQLAAAAEQTRLVSAGFKGSADFTGWDGSATDKGPWNIQVLTIDPRRLRGSIKTSFGPDIEKRETTSQLAALDHAAAGINAGYFVLNPAAGAPGDPAGVGVYHGALLSEPTNGLPGLILHSNARNTTRRHLHHRQRDGPFHPQFGPTTRPGRAPRSSWTAPLRSCPSPAGEASRYNLGNGRSRPSAPTSPHSRPWPSGNESTSRPAFSIPSPARRCR